MNKNDILNKVVNFFRFSRSKIERPKKGFVIARRRLGPVSDPVTEYLEISRTKLNGMPNDFVWHIDDPENFVPTWQRQGKSLEQCLPEQYKKYIGNGGINFATTFDSLSKAKDFILNDRRFNSLARNFGIACECLETNGVVPVKIESAAGPPKPRGIKRAHIAKDSDEYDSTLKENPNLKRKIIKRVDTSKELDSRFLGTMNSDDAKKLQESITDEDRETFDNMLAKEVKDFINK